MAGHLRVFDGDATQCDHREHSRSQVLVESGDSAEEWQGEHNLPEVSPGMAHTGQW